MNWNELANIKLPEEIRFTGTEQKKKESPDYSLEEILASEGLWWFRSWGSALLVPGWEMFMDYQDPKADTSPHMPKNVDEVSAAFDIMFLGHAPEPFKSEVLEACSRCRFWHLGGTTGTWDRWARAELAKLGFAENEHPFEKLYGELFPISTIWEVFLDDRGLYLGAPLRWDDPYRIDGTRELGLMLGIDTAIEAYLAGASLEYVLQGKRIYDCDGQILKE